MIVPASSTATKRVSSTAPVSGSISTTAMWVPNGKVEPAWVRSETVSSGSSVRASATRSHPTDTDGVPTTWNSPRSLSSTTSAALASRSSAATSVAAATSFSLASATAEPAICTDREPPVTPPDGTRSVSPWITSMRSIGTPRRSEASIAHVVT